MRESWDGIERRKKAQDHDTLIQVVQILKNHVENFDKHAAQFEQHVKDDNESFQLLMRKVDLVFRYVYMGLGGVTLFTVLIKMH